MKYSSIATNNAIPLFVGKLSLTSRQLWVRSVGHAVTDYAEQVKRATPERGVSCHLVMNYLENSTLVTSDFRENKIMCNSLSVVV